MLKKLILAALVVAFTIPIVACGSGGDAGSGDSGSPPIEADKSKPASTANPGAGTPQQPE